MVKENHAGAKERIRQVATDLFAKKGFDATSVREIVEAAGVSKPTLYYYFESKEGLAAALVVDITGEFREALSQMSRSVGDLPTFVAQIIEENFRFTRRHFGMMRFLFATVFGGQGKSFRPDVLTIYGESIGDTKEIVRRGAVQKGLSAPRAELLSEAVTTVMRSEIMEHVAGVGRELTEDRARGIAEYLVAGARHVSVEDPKP